MCFFLASDAQQHMFLRLLSVIHAIFYCIKGKNKSVLHKMLFVSKISQSLMDVELHRE